MNTKNDPQLPVVHREGSHSGMRRSNLALASWALGAVALLTILARELGR
jgi:hypothetical protein